jgi:hypothetical protein
MKVDFTNLQLQYETCKKKKEKKINANLFKILVKSNYILGVEVHILEKELQNLTL